MTTKFVGTAKEKIDLHRARGILLRARADLGDELDGMSVSDLLADNTNWSLVRCQNVARVLLQETAGDKT